MLNIKSIISYLDNHQVNYTYHGIEELNINGFCPLNNLKSNSMTWIRDVNSYNVSLLYDINNLLVICNQVDNPNTLNGNFILTDNPHSVYFSLLSEFFDTRQTRILEHSNSVIESKSIGKNVSIGHFCYIGKDVIIEDNVTIHNNVSIDGKIHIGKNSIIYSGVVIGMDGYGYFDDVDNNHKRVPHLGGVMIGENVEIGANTCIAKGCLGDTIISDDVKIDNLCHIAHNVFIGKRSKIIALSMLAGSSVIGEDVWVAPCSAVKNQVVVGDNSLVGLGAVVLKNVEPNTVVAGVPAKALGSK